MALGSKTTTIPSVTLNDTQLSDLFFNREHQSSERADILEDAIAFSNDMGVRDEERTEFVDAVVDDFFARL